MNIPSSHTRNGFVTSELVVAISLGFAIGLIVMYGVWTANRSMKTRTISPVAGASTTPTTAVPENSPTPEASTDTQTTDEAEPVTEKLSLTTPAQYSLATSTTQTINGLAPKNSTIIIYTEAGEQTVTVDNKGEFTAEIKLIPGSNAITIVSFNTKGEYERIDRTIVLNRES